MDERRPFLLNPIAFPTKGVPPSARINTPAGCCRPLFTLLQVRYGATIALRVVRRQRLFVHPAFCPHESAVCSGNSAGNALRVH